MNSLTLVYFLSKLHLRLNTIKLGRENCLRLLSNRKDRHDLVLRYSLECPVNNPSALQELERLNADVTALDPQIRKLQSEYHQLEQGIDDDIFAILHASFLLRTMQLSSKRQMKSHQFEDILETA